MGTNKIGEYLVLLKFRDSDSFLRQFLHNQKTVAQAVTFCWELEVVRMAEQTSNDLATLTWILISGTTSPTKSVKASDKTRRNGSYLEGITKDLSNMQAYVKSLSHKLDNTVQDRRISTKLVLDRIKECSRETRPVAGSFIHIYYTGHGEAHTGNWCFKNGTISLKSIISAVKSVNSFCGIRIYADCCYAGNWAAKLGEFEGKYKRITLKAACWPERIAYDTQDGGPFTLVQTGKNTISDFGNLKLARCYADLNFSGEYTLRYLDIRPSIWEC